MRLLKHHLRRIRLPKVPLCWSGRLGQRPSSQQAVLSTIIIQLLILPIVSHRPSRPDKRLNSRTAIKILRSRLEKLAKSRTTSSFCPSHPEKRLDSRTAIEILRSRPEKRLKSRMTSSFCPSHPEKRLDSRTVIRFQQKCAFVIPSNVYVPVRTIIILFICEKWVKSGENEYKYWNFR